MSCCSVPLRTYLITTGTHLEWAAGFGGTCSGLRLALDCPPILMLVLITLHCTSGEGSKVEHRSLCRGDESTKIVGACKFNSSPVGDHELENLLHFPASATGLLKMPFVLRVKPHVVIHVGFPVPEISTGLLEMPFQAIYWGGQASAPHGSCY